MASELIPLIRQFEDGERRIRDLDLACALGYENPVNIRKLIRAHWEQLEEFGVISTVEITSGALGGRPAQEYWLNINQARLLCKWVETANADRVIILLVEVFAAVERGEYVPAQDTPDNRALAIRQNEIAKMFEPFLSPIKEQIHAVEQGQRHLQESVALVQQSVDAGFTEMRVLFGEQTKQLGEVVEDTRRRRKQIREKDRWIHIEFLNCRRAGVCPCCEDIAIVSDGLPTPAFQMDHWYGRYQHRLHEIWPVCKSCNRRLFHEPEYKTAKAASFVSYHQALKRYRMPPLYKEMGMV